MLDLYNGSRAMATPIHLYRVTFGIGAQSRILLTDAETLITVGNEDYQSATIKHSEIRSSGSLDRASMELSVPFDSPLVDLFRVYPPSQEVELTIYRGDAFDPDAEFFSIWSGRIINFAIEGSLSKLTCEPVTTSMRRPGLRLNYQYSCPHILYGGACGASQAAATTTSQAVSFSGVTVTLPADWWPAGVNPAKYRGGMVSWVADGETFSRMILKVQSLSGPNRELLLGGVLTGLTAGTAINVVLGCNHQVGDCRDVHNNLPAYGGCIAIPTDNPVGAKNNFY